MEPERSKLLDSPFLNKILPVFGGVGSYAKEKE
jgi:hypothetical protein